MDARAGETMYLYEKVCFLSISHLFCAFDCIKLTLLSKKCGMIGIPVIFYVMPKSLRIIEQLVIE